MKKWLVKVYEPNGTKIGGYLVPARNKKEARDNAILFYAKRSLLDNLPIIVVWAWGR